MKILAAHQPAIHPWLGYLDRIRQADVFVILAGVQFEKNSFTNRNQIMLDGNPQWLTVPLKMKGHTSKPISEMEIEQTRPWRRKHTQMIRHAYSKAPNFRNNWPKIKELYASFTDKHFIDVYGKNLVFWMMEYGLHDKLETMQTDHHPNVKSKQLINLCEMHGCDTYLSGPFGREYLDMEAFSEAGIEVRFHEPDFQPISVIDTWMKNKGNPFSL